MFVQCHQSTPILIIQSISSSSSSKPSLSFTLKTPPSSSSIFITLQSPLLPFIPPHIIPISIPPFHTSHQSHHQTLSFPIQHKLFKHHHLLVLTLPTLHFTSPIHSSALSFTSPFVMFMMFHITSLLFLSFQLSLFPLHNHHILPVSILSFHAFQTYILPLISFMSSIISHILC